METRAPVYFRMLRGGEIKTFSMTNKSVVRKAAPPGFDLRWSNYLPQGVQQGMRGETLPEDEGMMERVFKTPTPRVIIDLDSEDDEETVPEPNGTKVSRTQPPQKRHHELTIDKAELAAKKRKARETTLAGPATEWLTWQRRDSPRAQVSVDRLNLAGLRVMDEQKEKLSIELDRMDESMFKQETAELKRDDMHRDLAIAEENRRFEKRYIEIYQKRAEMEMDKLMRCLAASEKKLQIARRTLMKIVAQVGDLKESFNQAKWRVQELNEEIREGTKALKGGS